MNLCPPPGIFLLWKLNYFIQIPWFFFPHYPFLHPTCTAFKHINFPLRFEYTHVIFVSFPGRTDKHCINQILPKHKCYSRKLQVFPSWDTFLHTFLQKLCQLYFINVDVMSTDDCTGCSEIFVLQCDVCFHCGMTRFLCSTGLHHNTLKFNPFMFWK